MCHTFTEVAGTPGANLQQVVINNIAVSTATGCSVINRSNIKTLFNGINPLFNIEVFSAASQVSCGSDAVFTIESSIAPNSTINSEVDGVPFTEPFGTPDQDIDGDGIFILTVTVPNVNSATTDFGENINLLGKNKL